MKAWIMSVEPFRVSVFQASSEQSNINFSTVIKNNQPFRSMAASKQISDGFAKYIAEEIEIACGCGTDSSLIISGDEKDVQKVCNCLSLAAKKSIIGITPKGYHPLLWKEVLTSLTKTIF
jgi:hypothetical protein